MSAPRKRQLGTATFVAAGPGDAELLTVRAVRAIASAEVVISDSDALDIAKRYAAADSKIQAAVDDSGLPLSASARAKAVVDAVKSGQKVVRLFSGDPVLDGAFGRESVALEKAKLSYDFVPGVSTVSGIAAYAGVSLTSSSAREVRIVDAQQPDVDWSAHCQPHVTLVALNGADQATEISKALLKGGRPGHTPVVITRAGTTVEQRSVVATLDELPAAVKAAKQTGNGVVIVGEPAAARQQLSWFESKPLFGWRLLLPRTKDSLTDLSRQLELLGASVTDVPTLSVEPPRTPQQMDRAITGLVSGRYEWVVFTCANSVRAVWAKCQEYGLDARAFAGLRLAASGDGTNAQLAEYGIRADIAMPDGASTSDLLEEFPVYDQLADPINRVFLPRADVATESLAAGIAELGWEVEDVTAFRTVRAAPPAAEIRDAIKSGGFDAVLFTSSATVRNLVGIAGKPHAATVVCCIGPQTAKACVEHGLQVTVQAVEPTTAGLLNAVAEHGAQLRDAAIAQGESSWRPSRRKPSVRRKVT